MSPPCATCTAFAREAADARMDRDAARADLATAEAHVALLRRELEALRGQGAAGEHRALVRAEAMRSVVFGTPAAVAVTQAEDALRRVLAAEDARAGRVPR